MAKNRLHAQSNQDMPNLVVTPAAALSGDPVMCGQIPGVAMSDADALNACVMQRDGIFTLSVNANNGAVALGDILYWHTGTPGAMALTNTSSGGTRFGYALAAVTSAATTAIAVQVGY